MARLNYAIAASALTIIAGASLAHAASAQDYRVVQPVKAADANVKRSAFVRPGDVSPMEQSRLLEEADRIRAFQSAQNLSAPQVPAYSAPSNTSPGMRPQTYSEYIAAKRQAQAAMQQPQQPYAAPRPVYQSQPTYIPPRGNTYAASQPVYQQPAPQPYTQAPIPRNRTYQAPANNPVIYAATPDVMGTVSATTTTMLPTNTMLPAATVGMHNVVKGDTLYSLSKRYGVTLASLKQANGLTGNLISVGQKLVLPGVMPTRPASYSVPVQNTVPTQYTQPRNYQRTSPNAATHVPTTSYGIVPGTNMIKAVQPVPPSGVYAVLPKDTLYGIARFACVNPYDVARLNGITDSTALTPGQKLNMPSGHCLN